MLNSSAAEFSINKQKTKKDEEDFAISLDALFSIHG